MSDADKACSKCGYKKALTEFPANRSKGGGRDSECRICKRDRTIQAKYGITSAQYDALLLKQGGVCALCLGTERTRRLAVDHDHGSGAVRGILCGPCNKAIGALRDRPVLLLRAALYLLEHAERKT